MEGNVNQTILDPSLDSSIKHNLARKQIQGIPSYLDQPDVIKAIRD